MDLSAWGWDVHWAAAWAAEGNGNCVPGRVVWASRNACRVITEDGERMGSVKPGLPVVCGDWVGLDADGRAPFVLARRSALARRKAGRATEEQVIAANVDALLIVMGLDADYNLRRLERYLVLAAAAKARPLVVLNKTDQCADWLERMREVDRLARADVVAMAAGPEPESVAQLHRYLSRGETALLAGSSGAGKSTITNALLGEARQSTLTVREGDGRGRHTTTARELFLAPGPGWVLMDTPGMRELEVWNAEPSAVPAAFAEIAELAAGCRFRDCRHSGEPGCAVAAAVDADRLASFHKLNREVNVQERRRWEKLIARAIKRMPKRE